MSYANTNYAPSTKGQTSMVNGMPQQMPPYAQQQFQQQQQQVLQQKQLFQPPSLQQQQQAQQQQQHQLQQQYLPSTGQPPLLNSNMSKFMPPALASSNSAPQILNGPQRPLTAQAPVSNLPPHLRPPGMNGPLGPPLTNGGGDGSTHSSRTGSPALQTAVSQQQQQQVQQQQPIKPAMPLNSSVTSSPTMSVGSLSGSMQNLNLNRVNGQSQLQPPQQQPPLQSQIPPTGNSAVAPPTLHACQQFPPNVHAAFKTSALNATNPNVPSVAPTSALVTASSSAPNLQRPVQVLASYPSTAAPVSPPHSSSVYGTSTAPLMLSTAPNPAHQGPPSQNLHQSMSTPFLPPPSISTMQQNQLNNNSISTQRKPMYPTTAQLPPMPIPSAVHQQQQPQPPQHQQQQQQYPYAPAYQQQAQATQPGMFNGQPNTGPLQYQQQQPGYPPAAAPAPNQFNSPMGVVQQGFNSLWGQDTIDLMQNRHVLTKSTLQPPRIVLHNQLHESVNCNPNIIRCTIAKIPESNALLQKSRLPLGILIHPFRDINSLPVIQCPNIVRCRLCRTYINPYVYFVDSKMWKCNLCYRVNELPEDFQFDPATKTYGDVTRRPEVRSSTIEFIAPSEYMLRPPQPAIYLFLFDVSIIAQQSGYLENVCVTLSKHLEDMPGDVRTQVGFIAYNSEVHFYSLAEGYNQPHEMTLLDIDDVFLPRPDNLLVNLKECKELIKDLLQQLPQRFADTHDPGSALGAALQVAYKLMQASGGRVTVFQTCLPNKGPGALEPREDPNNRSAKDVAHLNPATDFYKRHALECSGYQIAVDLFLLNQQYSDLATISGISKHSGGCVHHFPLYQKTKSHHVDALKHCFKRYLVRKIGFEAVMRIRCTRGLQVHTFHGNFFVRSTDLLSLPNVNPDAGYGMQISYEESLTDVKTICFQAALLYTNSEGERRIRVHTLCLPVTASLPEVMHAADSEAIIGLLSKMAVDRSIASNVADARDAFVNATVDIFNAFKIAQNLPSGQTNQLVAPRSLALMPLYILALLKHPAFRVGTSTRLDDRVFAMDCMKTLPLDQLMKFIYPEFYNLNTLFYNAQNSNNVNATDDEEDDLPEVPRLKLSAEYLDSHSIFLLDCGTLIMLYVGINVPGDVLENTLGIKSTAELPDYYYGLPNVNSPENDVLKRFVMKLNDEKPYPPIVQIIRDTSTAKPQFIEKLVDDRSESSLSYYEFLQHIRTQVK